MEQMVALDEQCATSCGVQRDGVPGAVFVRRLPQTPPTTQTQSLTTSSEELELASDNVDLESTLRDSQFDAVNVELRVLLDERVWGTVQALWQVNHVSPLASVFRAKEVQLKTAARLQWPRLPAGLLSNTCGFEGGVDILDGGRRGPWAKAPPGELHALAGVVVLSPPRQDITALLDIRLCVVLSAVRILDIG